MKPLTVFAGLASLVWFLVRVIPKPSRAAYPCQRAAAPLASGFVVWLTGLVAAKALHRRAQALARRSRYGIAVAALAAMAVALWLPLGANREADAQEPFTPSEGPNKPMGVGKGIHPGRVVWSRDPGATPWDGATGNWWDDANTNQQLVSGMMSNSIRALTGESTDKAAWAALFRSFNQTHGGGNTGYRAGEKIAIKINANQDRGQWNTGMAMPSPHMVYALVSQLIESAGVRGEDITVYDASRNIGDPIVRKVRGNASPAFQAVRFVANREREGAQTAAEFDSANPIHFADSNLPEAYPPKCVTEAKYLINMALFRAHTMFGVTLTAKNHFGSVYFPNGGGFSPRTLHNFGGRTRPMGSYNCLVDLIGYKHFGGKTMLYLLDGLYPGEHNEAKVMRFESFGNQWAASLFASQDPVAIDSVALDFLRNEPRATQVRGSADNYLHEAAQANKPPSGVTYDPSKEGKPLTSLGVHEHWNNATERKYSRNLGKNEGIELVTLAKQ